MSTLVHLSDLHFGKDRPDLLEPLVTCVNALSRISSPFQAISRNAPGVVSLKKPKTLSSASMPPF